MKKTIILIVSMFALANLTFATDLLVTSNGQAGAYASVTEALAAAQNGDRIFVEPQAGNTPYADNITINKSIQLLSNSENDKFRITGNITISPNAVIEILIIGLELDGSITADKAAPATTRSTIKILGSKITRVINIDQNNYDLLLSNSEVTAGIVTCRAGNFYGNILNSIVINAEDGLTAPYLSDSLQIIGNRFDGYTTITSNSGKFYYIIANNFIRCTSRGIFIPSWKDAANAENLILNNTIYNYDGDDHMFLSNVSSNVSVKIVNNALYGYSVSYAIRLISNDGMVYLGYNFLNGYSTNITGITYDNTNKITSFTYNSTTGEVTDKDNLGHPDPIYNDIDLSRSNLGCYGGPYSMANYIPSAAFGSKIIHLDIPRRILVGNKLTVKAKAYDR